MSKCPKTREQIATCLIYGHIKKEDCLAELDAMEDKLSNLRQGYNEHLVIIEKLVAENKRYREAINHYLTCLDAAKCEGLDVVLANTEDERLKDLLNRRVFYDSENVFNEALKEVKK